MPTAPSAQLQAVAKRLKKAESEVARELLVEGLRRQEKAAFHGHCYWATAARIQCEWYHVATIDFRSTAETLAVTLQVDDGENQLRPATEASVPRANPPAFAPDPSPGSAAVPAQAAALLAPV